MNPRDKLNYILSILNSCVTLDQVKVVGEWFERLCSEQYFGGLKERTNIVYDFTEKLESKLMELAND